MTTRGIFLASLLVGLFLLLPNALPQRSADPDQQPKHFYVYNECYKPISSKLTYVPTGSESPTTTQVSVPPGNQKLLGTTYKETVETRSASDDGKQEWGTRKFSLTTLEYTHVITCKCPENDSSCKPPDKWPDAKSRQNPDGH